MKTIGKSGRIILLFIFVLSQSNFIFGGSETNYKQLIHEGNTAFKSADYKKAIKYYNEALLTLKKINKKHLTLLSNLGFAQMQLKEYRKALSSFSKYLRINERNTLEPNDELQQVTKWKEFCDSKLEDEVTNKQSTDKNLETDLISEDILEDVQFFEEIDENYDYIETDKSDAILHLSVTKNNNTHIEENNHLDDYNIDDELENFDDLDKELNTLLNFDSDVKLPGEPKKTIKKDKDTKSVSSNGIKIVSANIIPLSEYLAKNNMKVEELNKPTTKLPAKSNITNANYLEIYKASINGLVFKIQIGAYAFSVNNFSNEFPNINPKNINEEKGNLFKYTTGQFNNINEASDYKLVLKAKGYHDAFMTCYYYNKRISTNEAIRLIENAILQ